MEIAHAWVERILSDRKRTWTLEDYLLRLRRQDLATMGQLGRLKPIIWSAQIINWGLMGGHCHT